MKNKHNNIGTDIQDFIDYKLKHKKQSEEEAKALILKKKYQRILDGIFKQIDSRRTQLENMEYETKKMKKGIWDSLITVSNAVEKIQKDRYAYGSKIRQMNEQRQRISKQIEDERKMNAFQQKQLQDKIRVILEQSQYYFQQKTSLIDQLHNKKIAIQTSLNEKQPTVSQFLDKIIIQQDIETDISQLRKQKQTKIIQNKNLEKQLSLIKENKLKDEKLLQQIQNKQSEERRIQIIQCISSINKAFIQNKNVKQNIQRLKNKINSLAVEEQANDEEKFKHLKQKMLETKSARTGADIYIKESLIEESLKEIKYLKTKIQQLESHQKDLIKKEEQVAKIEEAKDKQIKRLEQTIIKMEESLAKR